MGGGLKGSHAALATMVLGSKQCTALHVLSLNYATLQFTRCVALEALYGCIFTQCSAAQCSAMKDIKV